MQNFDQDYYVPILFTKRGERTALANSTPSVIKRLRPLFVVPPVDWDYENDQPKKSVGEHISAIPSQLVQCWGTDDAFIDLQMIDDTGVHGGHHPLAWVVDQAAALGLNLTPVVSPSRTSAYLAAAASLAPRTGACVRLQIGEWPASVGAAGIDELLKTLGISPTDAHLVLDLGDDVGAAAGMLAAAELRSLPHLADWRSVTVAGTGIPETMPAGSGLHTVGRHEWRIYQALLGLPNPLPRIPTFGDYAIGGLSAGPDVDPKVLSISATLRYTLPAEWLVAKGGLWKGSGGRSLGGAAVPPAAQLLASHGDFMGAAHCGFEAWLMPVSNGAGGGNPEGWRRYGTEHHLQVVTEQIASLGGTSTAP